jgi:lipid-A-disaccharide synthase
MGVTEAAGRIAQIARAWRAVLRAVRARRPQAALLVNYSEFNSWLARRLKRARVRVVWYGAPQVWAWRAGRAPALASHVDRMAVMLPFEASIWRSAGADARYVGHPALESTPAPRSIARAKLGMSPCGESVALLPGSRPHEVRSLLLPMLEAYRRVRSSRTAQNRPGLGPQSRPALEARVLMAPSLDPSTRDWLRLQCRCQRVDVYEVDPLAGALEVLGAFDAALCASGTASLEAALAGAVPVVAYRVGRVTLLAARLLVRTPHLALPNVLLQRRVFSELVQERASSGGLAGALHDALDRRSELEAACREVRARLGQANQPSAEVAGMLCPWLDA